MTADTSLLIGLGAGLLLGAGIGVVASRVIVRRAVARVRVAERRARSAERMAEIGSMTGGLAHEIKNPLSTIGLNAQLLQEAIADLGLPEQDAGRLGRRIGSLRQETERLRGILSDFLEYAGELRLSFAQTDIGVLLDELGDFFDPQARASGVRLRIEPPHEQILARIDSANTKQALLNLMLNAVSVMETHEGGTRDLILRAERCDDHGVDSARIHVIDTGPGMPPETVEKIFRPYYTTRAGGSGLGLPTARRIAEAHRGRLEVHSTPGVGSDFSVTLPISAEGPLVDHSIVDS
ncbi:MAG: PAS domain-containing sensor histidine kinase [Phycisphaerales bacterium]